MTRIEIYRTGNYNLHSTACLSIDDDSHNSAETNTERERTVWFQIKSCCEDTSVATEDLLINNGCNRQTVEAVSEGFPQLYVVSPLACGWQTI